MTGHELAGRVRRELLDGASGRLAALAARLEAEHEADRSRNAPRYPRRARWAGYYGEAWPLAFAVRTRKLDELPEGREAFRAYLDTIGRPARALLVLEGLWLAGSRMPPAGRLVAALRDACGAEWADELVRRARSSR